MQPVADGGIFEKSENLEKKNNSFEEQNQIESEARRQKVAVRTARSVSENKELLTAL